jgi:hypothetical protein
MPEGSGQGNAATSHAAEPSSAAFHPLGLPPNFLQSALPPPPWANTRQQSLSVVHTTTQPDAQPRLAAAQWPVNPPNTPAHPPPAQPRTPSPRPPANNAQQHFYYPPVNNRYMPGPGERAAPRFDGTPRGLSWFLDEIDVLARQCQLSSRDHIAHALRYLDPRDREVWEGVATSVGGNWPRFKTKIIALYPGSDQRYTTTELMIFVENQAAVPMTDLTQFGEYHRQFLTRANWLFTNNKLSQRERSSLFLAGLHVDFRNQVRTQLRLLEPRHPLDEPYTISQIEEAVKYLLVGSSGHNILAYPTLVPQAAHPIHSSSTTLPPQPAFPPYVLPAQPAIPSFPSYTSYPPAQPAPVAPAQETFDVTAMKHFMTSMTEDIIKTINANIGQRTASSFVQQPHSSNFQSPPQSGCRACSDPGHFIRACPKVMDYVRQGRCIKDQMNRICLPNGVFVSQHLAPGKDILERVDNWYRSHPAGNDTTTSIVQTNIIEATPIPCSSNQPTTATTQFQATTDPDAELRILDAVTVGALKRQEEIRAHAKSGGSKAKGNLTSSNIPTKTVPASSQVPVSSSQQQFRYSTPIEDPAITQNVIQKSLDTPFPITLRELYSTSPDVRKFIRDQVTTRRIPIGQSATVSIEEVPEDSETAVASFAQHSHHLDSIIVASQIEDLRTIELEFNGKISVNAILDEGSQITAIRKDIWERLGLPLLSNEKMVMESANSSREPTLGLLRDLPVRIGRCTFYLQVQVVANASYDMLLGRPFLTLTEARTHHYSNGDSHITLLDPNSHDTFTIPTRPRIRSDSPAKTTSGFQ